MSSTKSKKKPSKEADTKNSTTAPGEEVAAASAVPQVEVPEWRQNLPETLAVLPLRGVVLFPGTVAPLTVERDPSRRLLEDSLSVSRTIGIVTQRDEEKDLPLPEDIYAVGVIASVLRMVRQEADSVIALVQVHARVRFTQFTQVKPFLKASFEVLENVYPEMEGEVWTALLRNLRESAINLVRTNPNIPDEASQIINSMDDPVLLGDFLATNLPVEIADKQMMLEETNVEKRIEMIQRHVNNQTHIAELQRKLRDDVETEFSDAQRKAFLREQMRAIQRELGEEVPTDEQGGELHDRLLVAGLPKSAMVMAEKELKRLEFIPPGSPEHSVIVTYLETLADLPWNKFSEDRNDLAAAREILEHDHYGLEKVKKRLVEYLAVRKLNPGGRGPILCLVGPPGVGKTSLGKSIADALGRSFIRISVGGMRDESEIRGHRRTYIGSMPGRMIQEIRRCGTRNPVIMLDEVDKIGADFRGDPASALLEVLDPRQNDSFMDRYLDVPFDLSQAIFIATANTLDPVPHALRDRLEVIEIPGYTEEEKLHIARNYLVKRQLKENGLKNRHCRWGTPVLKRLIRDYTREAGVRNLEREIGSVCRSVAAGVAEDDSKSVTVSPEVLADALGPAKFAHEDKLEISQPGMVNGLAYTPVGGEILHIEAIRYPGDGRIQLTGQIGDVMKESMQAAWSLVRNRADGLGIDREDLKKFDVHVHVPAGAVPKDGPSAGVAMFSVLASLFTGKPLDRHVAMTGEITLRGLVLPIGGLKEKALAAERGGIRKVLIPNLNMKDVPEIPEAARKHLKIIGVKTVDDVLGHAFSIKA